MDVLDQLWVAWQPIVDLHTGNVAGYEALIRGPAATRFATPAALFAWAEVEGRSPALEEACKRLAYETAHDLWADPAQRVFLNIDGRWPTLPGPWETGAAGEIPLAVEVSEARSVLNDEGLLAALERWRQHGHLIVMDDYGTGYAGMAGALVLQPELVKLDRVLIAGVDHNIQKQSLVRAVRTWTDDLGIALLAEGVETAAELAAVARLGCDYAQGYYVARPAAGLPRVSVPVPRTAPALSPAVVPSRALAFYAQAVADSGIPSYVVDRRRELVAWNAAAERLLGHPAGDLVGRRCAAGPLDHRDAAGRLLCRGFCPLVHSMAEHIVEAAVVSAADAAGQRHQVETWVTPIFDSALGRVVGALEQFREVEQRGDRLTSRARPQQRAACPVRVRLRDSQARTGALR